MMAYNYRKHFIVYKIYKVDTSVIDVSLKTRFIKRHIKNLYLSNDMCKSIWNEKLIGLKNNVN